MRSVQITARTDPNVKASAQTILKKIGLSMSDAINLFLNQIILNKGLPFDVRIPNEETVHAMEDAIHDQDLESAENLDEMFEKLGI